MFALAVVAFLGVFVVAVQLDKHNRPPKDLRLASLADGKAVIVDDNTNPLSVQNLSAHELSERLSNIVAETLSFTASDFASGSRAAEKYFTPSGYQQYVEFLTSAEFERSLRDQNLKSGAYVEEPPVELTHGVYEGVYKWVFEVPVTVSFIDTRADTYRDGEIKPVNRRFILRAQFARVKEGTDPNAVKIELWQILPTRNYQ